MNGCDLYVTGDETGRPGARPGVAGRKKKHEFGMQMGFYVPPYLRYLGTLMHLPYPVTPV